MPTVATAATMAARSQPQRVPLGAVGDGDGMGAMILDGVEVGQGAVIGAGTVRPRTRLPIL
jgi:tetrahydrodipicolinate N-succinyltransferase